VPGCFGELVQQVYEAGWQEQRLATDDEEGPFVVGNDVRGGEAPDAAGGQAVEEDQGTGDSGLDG
jgi:hypothetical protein